MFKNNANPLGPVLALSDGKRPWPAIPAIELHELPALQQVVGALRLRAQVQSREVGNDEDSFTTLQDMVSLGVIDAAGRLLVLRVVELEQKVTALEQEVTDLEARLDAAGIP